MTASYRVQLSADFPFAAAEEILDHLQRLNCTYLYTSPIMTAIPGSSHFYDGVDPTTVSDELGGEDGLRRLVAAMEERGLGLLVDLVPNHLSVARPHLNRWWWETLRDGPDAACAHFFDIDWDAGDGQVILPFLPDRFEALDRRGAVTRTVLGGEPVLDIGGFVVPGGDAERRYYRLETGRDGRRRRNYRVFFEVSGLAAIRMEDDEVFDTVTAKLAGLIDDGLIDGLRLDHVDGLADPGATIARFRGILGPDRLLLVEKITIGDEQLPADWPVQGSTGYDFAHDTFRLMTDPGGAVAFTPQRAEDRFEAIEYHAKCEVIDGGLGAGADQLSRLANVSFECVKTAAAHFDIYRTYLIDPVARSVDRAGVERAFNAARAARPDLTPELDALGRQVLSPENGREREVRQRFQQFTAPVMARGVEDTAMYRYVPLLGLNEVGSDPGVFSITASRFHQRNLQRLHDWPGAMLTTSTHDTKRSEDVRARLAALTGCPDEWFAFVVGAENAQDSAPPHQEDRSILWQSIVGTWPGLPLPEGYPDRILAYMTKALREAKRRSGWTDPDIDYEQIVEGYARGALSTPAVLAMIDRFVSDHLLWAGRRNSIAQTLLRCTSPGFPDLYRGCESWDLSLVDPDNRRRLDWPALTEQSTHLEVDPVQAWTSADSGLVKMLVIARALGLRLVLPDSFGPGSDYLRLPASSERIVAFRRAPVIVVAPFVQDGSVELPPGSWTDRFTNRTWQQVLDVGEMVSRFPVGLLVPT